ncbi:hypothetical protein Zmor_023404 [Zophobas morio]|uniref:Uncharacterized protein n=1 Tax=Zophobas morio TaxID=2755281 RepID=A0AA38M738_9CUCU|nr:hypothetical protein Zmor_023404 [Zophobas morio]
MDQRTVRVVGPRGRDELFRTAPRYIVRTCPITCLIRNQFVMRDQSFLSPRLEDNVRDNIGKTTPNSTLISCETRPDVLLSFREIPID